MWNFVVESWILYNGSNQAVSKTVRGAYNNYKTREFGMQCSQETETRNDEIEKKKHIKLISISDEKVNLEWDITCLSINIDNFYFHLDH